MAGFRTNYEQKKWDELGNQANMTFDRLRKGVVTQEDLAQVASLVPAGFTVAKATIDTAIQSIEKAAEERINKIIKRRDGQGKSPLNEEQIKSLLETAMNKAVKDEGVEIVTSLEAIIQNELDQQSDLLAGMVEDKLEKYDPVKRTNDFVGPNSDQGLPPALEKRFKELEAKYAESVSSQGFLGKTMASSGKASEARAFEKEVTNAAKQSNITNEEIKELLKKYSSESATDKDDEKRATTWMRKFGFGDRSKNKEKGKLGSILMTALKAAAGLFILEMTGSGIFEKIGNLFSAENMTAVASATWDYIARKGKELADYIGNLFKDAQEDMDKKAGVEPTDNARVRAAKLAKLRNTTLANASDQDDYAGRREQARKDQARIDKELEEAKADQEAERKASRGKIPWGKESSPGSGGGSTPPASGNATPTPEASNPPSMPPTGDATPTPEASNPPSSDSPPAIPSLPSESSPSPDPTTAAGSGSSETPSSAPAYTFPTWGSPGTGSATRGSTRASMDGSGAAAPLTIPSPGASMGDELLKRTSSKASGAGPVGIPGIPNASGVNDYATMYNAGMF